MHCFVCFYIWSTRDYESLYYEANELRPLPPPLPSSIPLPPSSPTLPHPSPSRIFAPDQHSLYKCFEILRHIKGCRMDASTREVTSNANG
jgi:hypothetical protein